MKITVLTTLVPHTVRKVFRSDGSKESMANVTEASAQSVQVDSVDALVRVLREVSESSNKCIVPGLWKKDPNGRAFRVITDSLFIYKFGQSAESVESDGKELVSARKKQAIDQSEWVLFDSDDPPGMPDSMRAMSLSDRLAAFEVVLPGISSCERVELCGSSERVEHYGSRRATHCWLRVSNPELVEVMSAYLKVETSLAGLSFKSERFSRSTNEVIGYEEKTLFDLSVFVKGRIVFCAKPKSELGRVYPADIRVVNRGGGALQIDYVEVPSRIRLQAYRNKTGKQLSMSSSDGLYIRNSSDLRLLTDIEVQGRVKPLMDWLLFMEWSKSPKLRCESPFRSSRSEAAVIFHSPSSTSIFDSGDQTTYFLKM